MTIMNKKLIKSLKDDLNFQEFQKYLIEIVNELSRVDDLTEFSNEEAGEMARCRAMTIKTIHQILTPLVEFNEPKEHPAEKIKKIRQKYGFDA